MAEQLECKLLKVSEKEKLLEVIHKIETVDDEHGLKCCECNFILVYNRILGCGHKLCRECCDYHGISHCPECGLEIDRNKINQSSEVELNVHQMKIYCIYRKNGCSVVTSIAELIDHITECNFSTKALLPKVYNPNKKIHYDKIIAERFGELSSENSSLKEEFETIKLEFLHEIFKLKANFDEQKVSSEKQRRNIEEQRKEIEELKKKIEYQRKEIDRQKWETQIQKREIDRQNKELEEQKGEIERQKKEIERQIILATAQDYSMVEAQTLLNEDVTQLKSWMESFSCYHPAILTWDIRSLDKELYSGVFSYERADSSYFAINNWTLKVKFTIDLQKSNLYIFSKFVNINGSVVKRDSLLDLHRRTYTLVDRENGHSYILGDIEEPKFKFTGNQWLNERSGMLIYQYEQIQRLVKNDSILIKVELMPLTSVFLNEIHSYDGELLWKIKDFHKKREKEINLLRHGYESESFYSGRRGYRMKVHLYLNGYGKTNGKFISVYLSFCRGQFDDELPSDFRYNYTFTIVHPQDSTKNILSTSSQSPNFEIGRGYPEFVEISEILEGGYLENDVLTLHTSVQIL